MQKLTCVLDAKARLGECPRWDEKRSVLWWVDIMSARLHRFDPSTGIDEFITVPEHIGSFALTDDGGFVAGMRSGVYLLDETGGVRRRLAGNPEDETSNRFNDGCCDAHGRFWVGTVNEPKTAGNASLYCLSADSLTRIDGGFLTANGIAFSPDNRWIYYSDTPRFTIFRRPFDPISGSVGEREAWVRFHPDGDDRGRPDGASVDVEGYYWSALYEGSRIVRISPTGEVVAAYPLPAKCPTMCAFGGEDRRSLYVTTARHGRPEDELRQYPLSGGLFAMRVKAPGLPAYRSGLSA